eukprot:s49_g63.t1
MQEFTEEDHTSRQDPSGQSFFWAKEARANKNWEHSKKDLCQTKVLQSGEERVPLERVAPVRFCHARSWSCQRSTGYLKLYSNPQSENDMVHRAQAEAVGFSIEGLKGSAATRLHGNLQDPFLVGTRCRL